MNRNTAAEETLPAEENKTDERTDTESESGQTMTRQLAISGSTQITGKRLLSNKQLIFHFDRFPLTLLSTSWTRMTSDSKIPDTL